MNEPPLGCIGVVDTGGKYSRAIKWFTNSPMSHAVVSVGDHELVEGEPGGARVMPIDEYGDRIVWLTDMRVTDIDGYRGALLEPTDGQRAKIADTALDLAARRVKYNWLDFIPLALASPRLRLLDPAHLPMWAKRMASDETLVCSQLADLCWSRAGLHIFEGRVPGMVSPGDLYRAGGSPKVP